MIDIKGLYKPEVLAALYNRAKPQGLGFLHSTPGNMTTAQAEEVILVNPAQSRLEFDYLQGRVLKVDLSRNSFDPWLYDRDNGEGAAAAVIAALRNLPVDKATKGETR